MTDEGTAALPVFGSSAKLTYHGPLSAERAARIVAELAARGPATVVDYGCGWGELLLQILAAAPAAHGVGIDIFADDIAHARDTAARRGLADRVEFIEGPAVEHARPADLVISCGAYQAFGTVPEALKFLRGSINPGGTLLFAAEIWDRTPTEEQLANMWPGTTVDECLHLPELVDAAIAVGFRPLRIQTATRTELEDFESGHAAEPEEWLLANPNHPKAPEIRTRLDEHRAIWLRGLRDTFGFAFLTLAAA